MEIEDDANTVRTEVSRGPSASLNAPEEAMNEAAREIATRIGGHDEDRCGRIEDPRKACTCPPDESFRIALEVLDRVSRERTRLALERAIELVEDNMGGYNPGANERLMKIRDGIRGLSDGESVASEEK